MAFLSAHPDIRRSLRADVHMDMVGGDPYKNKSMLHVTETPWSLPSFVTDVGELFAETIRDGATAYAEDGNHAEAAVLEDRNGAPGTRNEFLADQTPYAEGSDHDDYDSSTIAVPSLYLRDWPDIYIHTDHDTLEQIDPTKLRRVALLGAASGYTYARDQCGEGEFVAPVLCGARATAAGRGFRARAASRARHPVAAAGRLVRGSQSDDADACGASRRSLRSFATYTQSETETVASSAKTWMLRPRC